MQLLKADGWRLLLELCHHCELHHMSTWHSPKDYEAAKQVLEDLAHVTQKLLRVEPRLKSPLTGLERRSKQRFRALSARQRGRDEVKTSSRRALKSTQELSTVHLPTPLLNQRMGACEVYLLPPKAWRYKAHYM